MYDQYDKLYSAVISHSDKKYISCISDIDRMLMGHMISLKYWLYNGKRSDWISVGSSDPSKKYDILIEHNNKMRQEYMKGFEDCFKWLALDTKK